METGIENEDEKPPGGTMKNNMQRGIAFPIRLSIVALVYTLQGASLEFLQYSVQTELVINGASNSQLAILSAMEYPWCMKFIWAPLQDAFFISKIGRRKTWVLGTLIMLALLWGLLSFYIRGMVDNLEVTWLAMAGVVTSLFLTSQDVSMDGWIVKLSENDHQMSKFSWWCSFGYSLGGLLSFTLYMWLSSESWCATYLGVDHSLLTSQQVVTTISIVFLLVTFMVALIPEQKDSMERLHGPSLIHPSTNLFGTEINRLPAGSSENSNYGPIVNEEVMEDRTSNLMKVLRKVSLVVYNKNLLFLAIFLFFSELGFAYFDNVGYVEMLSNGVSEDTYALYWLCSTICEGITGFLISSMCAGSQMKIYILSFLLRIFNGFFYSAIIYSLNQGYITEDTAMIIFGVQQCIAEIAYAMTTIPMLSFFMSVCDTQVEGTYIAFLSSILYAAPIWTATLMYTLSDYISAPILIGFSLGYDLIYIGIFWRKMMTLQVLPKNAWALKDD